MSLRMRFWRDERGTTFEGIALSVSIIAVAFVASADMLDYLMKARQPAQTPFVSSPQPNAPLLASGGAPKDTNIDYTPTASLPKLISRSVLDPCTGAVH